MKKIQFYCLALCAAAMLAGCGKSNEDNAESSAAAPESTVQIESETETESVAMNDGKHSFLTGEIMDEEKVDKRPVAVMLNNIKEGCPQSGIGQASVIYEAPVEGRITRLMGLFEDWESLDKIGSIRSSRDYFVYLALEYDAIYVHWGQATPYVGELLNSDRVDNISGAVAGISHPSVNAFFKSNDRKTPHNVYASGSGIMKDVEKFNYRLDYRDTHKQKFTFAADGKKPDVSGGSDAQMLYPGGKENNKGNGYSRVRAYFEYNEEDGKYYRYQYGGEQIDELTGEQVAVDNVVFQYCVGEVRDTNDYLAFGCHGDNQMKVQVFTQGKMTEGTWSRGGDADPAYYVDKNGKPIEFSQGKTWICIIWQDYADDVIIE